jgi:hypothetical protein
MSTPLSLPANSPSLPGEAGSDELLRWQWARTHAGPIGRIRPGADAPTTITPPSLGEGGGGAPTTHPRAGASHDPGFTNWELIAVPGGGTIALFGGGLASGPRGVRRRDAPTPRPQSSALCNHAR